MGKGAKGNTEIRSRKAAKKSTVVDNLENVKTFTIDEVRKHRTPNDAWMVYRNKVFDVSGWHEHPGGDVLFTHSGDDFTDIFNAFHPKSAFADLEKFYIGELDMANSTEGFNLGVKKTEEQAKFEEGYRNLRTQLIRDGMYKTSHAYYAMKMATQLSLWSVATYLVWNAGNCSPLVAWLSLVLSAAIYGLFFQQSGWLAHDYLHHQVHDNRFINDMMGFIAGNLFQGFSASWWKNKHNSHHAVPNLHESCPDAHDGDPDIDTMPLLAWSMTMARHAESSKFGAWMIKNQAVTYFPILTVARISWVLQSFFHVFDALPIKIWGDKKRHYVQYPKSEMFFLVLHYVWYFYAAGCAFSACGIGGTVAWICLNNGLCGLFLALVFGLGHNGMSTYDADKRPDFWKLQVTTTRNITSNWFNDWFCGGLQYQVDHHLFPMIPRHNLGKVNKQVTKFCKENGVTYHKTGLIEGTWEVLNHLQEVSTEFIKEFPAM